MLLLFDNINFLFEKVDERAFVQNRSEKLFEGDGPVDGYVDGLNICIGSGVKRQRHDIVRRK